MTSLTNRGYGIPKSSLDKDQLDSLRTKFTVKPYNMMDMGGDKKEVKFPIYLESSKKIYIPKAYGLKHYGKPTENKLDIDIEDIDINFNGSLRPSQMNPVESFIKAANNPKKRGGIINLQCAGGKCLGRDTPVIMFDGSIKMVQDIVVGDILMGDDSTPRNVLSLARGREMMYKVIPIKGDPYVVNESHILSLKSSINYSKDLKKGQIVDISVKDYLNLPASFHKRGGPLLGYRVPIDFETNEIDLDPYMIGYWLGDGDNRKPKISCQDSVVLHYFAKTLPKYGCSLTYSSQYDYYISGERKPKTPTTNNYFLKTLQKYNLIQNKHIPHAYKCNSREVRLQILAGLIDSDGHLKTNQTCFEICQKNEKIMDDIIYIARSLGFACYKAVKKTSWTYKGVKQTGTAFRIHITGKGIEEIPTKIPRKRASPRKQIKDVLVSRIRLEKLDIDDYYGFMIDGNHRFLLGDFTVTHNTVCALYIISKLHTKTLVIVHKDFLMDQWKERISQFLPTAKVGIIKGSVCNVENKDIIIGSLQSLSMKNYDPEVFKGIGLTINDECHHLGAEVFSRVFHKITTLYSLGLSATVTRKDGLTKVFKWHIGDIVYKGEQKKDTMKVIMKEYYDPCHEYSREYTMYNKRPNMSRMINNICDFQPRTKFIIDCLIEILSEEKDRKVLILSDRRNHLENLKKELDNVGIESGFYYGGLKQDVLKANEDKQILLGTYAYVSEGFDKPGLNTMILASPKSDIIQSVGRILRDKPEDREYKSLVIDIVDKFSIFANQARKRLKYYESQMYEIENDTIHNNNKMVELTGKCYIVDDDNDKFDD